MTAEKPALGRRREKGARASSHARQERAASVLLEAAPAAPSIQEVCAYLDEAYPNAQVELDFKTPLELLVATILAARCTDERVNRVTPPLFATYRSAEDFANADLEALETALKSTGSYRVKAKAVQDASRVIVERFGGEVPSTMEELLTLPRVARKTANVVLAMAFGLPSGVIVDVHVTRVCRRLGLSVSTDSNEIERELMAAVPSSRWIQLGASMVLLGRYICRAPNPLCGDCGLNTKCPKVGVDLDKAARATVRSRKTRASTRPSSSEPASGGGGLKDRDPSTLALPEAWQALLGDELAKPYFAELMTFIEEERAEHEVFPPPEDVFNAFVLTPPTAVKVLILGQDPYHDLGQAHGLCFSVRPGVKPPPSLVNIFKELKDDIGCAVPHHGCLEGWARQGILLLNAVLTVRAHQANSHKGRGWEKFTDQVIRVLSARSEPVVFVLWGGYAKKKAKLIDQNHHVVIEGAHPSPLSAKYWFGSRPFSKINAALEGFGKAPIDWELPDRWSTSST